MEKLFNFKDMIILHDLGKVCNCIFMGHIVNTCMYFFLSFVFFLMMMCIEWLFALFLYVF